MLAVHSRFPPELSDMVIDYLDGEDDSLAKTSLVSKSWVFRSRVHLFKRVVVTRDFTAFAAFLHANPHIGLYIQQLVLQGCKNDLASVWPNSATVTLEPVLLASILHQLPRLRSLQLHEVSFHGRSSPSYLSLFKLDELEMMNIGSSRDTTNDVLHILGLFSDIRCLSISSLHQVMQEAELASRASWHVPRNLRVASLKLEDVPTSIYLRTLGKTESVKTLRTVDADCVDLEDIEALSELLQQTGSNLQQLAVNIAQCFNDNVDTEDSDEDILLSSHTICDALSSGLAFCTQLSALDIAVSLDTCESDLSTSYDAWNSLSSLLGSVRTSSIRRIGIEISAEECFAPLQDLNVSWQPLRDVLNRFSSLENVTFTNCLGTSWCFSQEEKEIVRSNLPELCERGVLQVGY